jgi:hypothetical protein
MVLRRHVLAGSLLLVGPACQESKPVEPPKPPQAVAPAPAPTPPPAPVAPEKPKTAEAPALGVDCSPDGITAKDKVNGGELVCEHGRWEPPDVGFTGIGRAGRVRVAARHLRA